MLTQAKKRGPNHIYTFKYYEENKEKYLLHYKENMINTLKTV